MILPAIPPDPLPDSPDLQRLWDVLWVRVDVLDPRIENGKAPCGAIRDVDLGHVMPDHEYIEIFDLLCLLPLPAPLYYLMAPRSRFCRKFKGLRHRVERARRLRDLYRSVLDKGFLCDPKDVHSIPWILAAGQHTLRLNARHRAALARFLGIGTIPVLVVTPRDILALKDVPEKYRSILQDLPEPSIELGRRRAGVPSWLAGQAKAA